MAKKPVKQTKNAPVLSQAVDILAMEYMKNYATAVLEDRSIPSLEDGLKPVQRRILWSMYNLGLKHTGSYMKAGRVVGQCFAAGTKVATPTGSSPIEQLEVGDTVLTTQGPRKVTACIANPLDKMYRLTMANGTIVDLTREQEVKVLHGGKFYWIKACDLTPSHRIVCMKS